MDKATLRERRERHWHAADAPCQICGTWGRLVPIDSRYVVLRICLRCATARMRVQQTNQ